MIPARIAGATHYMGAPKGWKPEEDGNCCHLAVRVTDNVWESAWEPTPAEVAAISAGAKIVLRVVGGQPPVMLCVEDLPETVNT